MATDGVGYFDTSRCSLCQGIIEKDERGGSEVANNWSGLSPGTEFICCLSFIPTLDKPQNEGQQRL